jgi:membrane associated rhomboid family serine protease
MMLVRRDKLRRSPWIAAGTILGLVVGSMLSFAIETEERPSLTSVFCALGGAVVGLVVGIVLDRLKNRP